MKGLGRILAAAVVLFAVLAIISGVRSDPQGRLTAQSFGQGFQNLGSWFASTFGALGTGSVAGNMTLSALIALIVFAVLVILVPGARQGRGLVGVGVLSTALAVILFAPDLLTRMQGS